MNTLIEVRERLANGGREYRESFVASQLKRGIPFQARALRKQRNWSQAKLAEESGLTQGVVSRVLDPDYGNLTLNTILKLAAGFDVAFVGKFVPFSELGRWFLDQSEESVRVASFDEDSGFVDRKQPTVALSVSRLNTGFSMFDSQEIRAPSTAINDTKEVIPIDRGRMGCINTSPIIGIQRDRAVGES